MGSLLCIPGPGGWLLVHSRFVPACSGLLVLGSGGLVLHTWLCGSCQHLMACSAFSFGAVTGGSTPGLADVAACYSDLVPLRGVVVYAAFLCITKECTSTGHQAITEA